jgi:hypothetical protein
MSVDKAFKRPIYSFALIIMLRCRLVTTLPSSSFNFLGSKPRVFRVPCYAAALEQSPALQTLVTVLLALKDLTSCGSYKLGRGARIARSQVAFTCSGRATIGKGLLETARLREKNIIREPL